MLVRRPPCAALLPYVESLWVYREGGAAPEAKREWLLPGGAMQLVFRFSPPLRVLVDETDKVGRTFGPTLVGGIRAQSYLREVPLPERAVGAQLRAGAGALLLGPPADVLASRHTSLDPARTRGSASNTETTFPCRSRSIFFKTGECSCAITKLRRTHERDPTARGGGVAARCGAVLSDGPYQRGVQGG